MAETLTQPQSAEFNQPQATRESYRERLRRGMREAGSVVYSVLDVSAGIALARDDLKYREATMADLNERYDGILDRQSQPDAVSMTLENDIVSTFKIEMNRAVPGTERRTVAENVVAEYFDAMVAELQAHHPDWSEEKIDTAAAQRAHDMITLVSMNDEQRDTYIAASFDYRELRGEVAEISQEVSELKAERRERLGRMGSVAVKSLFGFGSRLRNVPHAVNARLTIAGMDAVQAVREWYGNKSVESKRTVVASAASVAVAGVAAYITMRLNGGSHGGGNFVLAGNETPLDNQPVYATGVGGNGEAVNATGVGGEGSPVGAVSVGGEHGPVNATGVGGETGPVGAVGVGGESESGPVGATGVGAEGVGGGVDLSKAKTTKELFGGDLVTKWPDAVKVSEWNSQTKDGSLWGISTELWQRSGVKNPSNAQVQQLVDALSPQAQPDGLLSEGQMLDLSPATDLLPTTK